MNLVGELYQLKYNERRIDMLLKHINKELDVKFGYNIDNVGSGLITYSIYDEKADTGVYCGCAMDGVLGFLEGICYAKGWDVEGICYPTDEDKKAKQGVWVQKMVRNYITPPYEEYECSVCKQRELEAKEVCPNCLSEMVDVVADE